MKVPDFLLAERDRDTDEEPRVMDGADISTAISRTSASPSPQDLDEHDRRVEPVAEIEPEREPEREPEPDLQAQSPAPIKPDLEKKVRNRRGEEEQVPSPDRNLRRSSAPTIPATTNT